jgi:hypothetical protein
MIRRFVPPWLGYLLAAALPQVQVAQQPVIDTLALRTHTGVLAHDSLEGRAAGSPGERAAAEYIAAQCRALGLSPAGDAFIQDVPLVEARILPETRLVVRTGHGERVFTFPDHVIPDLGTKQTLRGFRGPAAWVGADDSLVVSGGLGDLDLEGAVAVMIGRASDAAVDTLIARRAAGLMHVALSDETFALYRQSRGRSRLFHRDSTIPSSQLSSLPTAIVDITVARAILGGVDPAPQRLGGALSLDMAVEGRAMTSWNVGCVLPGSDPSRADTAIAFTAHLDHLGIGTPDASGDSIYNGFSDNAAGVAMLLAIAKARLGEPARPRHSWLFLFFGGEERGLLGSDYYVARPSWPLERIRAVINLDAGAPPAPPVTWRLAGVDSLGLGAIASDVAARHGWRVTMSPARANSDYYPFVRRGVPAVFIIPGPAAYEGLSDDSSNALRRRWDRYHQAGDEWRADFPYSGLARYAAFAYWLARALDPPTSRRDPGGKE